MQSRFSLWLNRLLAGPWPKRIASGAVIVFGILLMIWPDAASELIFNFIGGLLALGGLVCLAKHFLANRQANALNLSLYGGILLLILAGIVVMMKGFLLAFLPLLFGSILLIGGIVHGQAALAARESRPRSWFLWLAGAVVSGLLGILILIHPFGTGLMLIRIIGGAMVFEAVQGLFSGKRPFSGRSRDDDGVIHTDFVE